VEGLKIYERDAYRYMFGYNKTLTFDVTGVTVIEYQGIIISIVVPYGVNYECEGGHFTEQMTEEKFLEEYSWEPKGDKYAIHH
jgi:hypothetical protein